MSLPMVLGAPIEHILQPWDEVLNNSGLLGIINMPHFGWLDKANACAKQLLVCFHGRTLWLDIPIAVIVDLISEITVFPKAREDPSQYLRGRDNDKKLAQQLKERYGLKRDGHTYRIDNINERAVCIGAHILASKVIRGNLPVHYNSGVVSCV